MADSDPSDTADRKPRKPSALARPAVRIGLGLLLCALVIAGVAWSVEYMSTGRYLEETDDAYLRADSVAVAPKINGYVEIVQVSNNQDVQAGQALVKVDPRDYRAQSAQSQSQIDVANANADSVRAQIKEQDAAIAQARIALTTAQSSAAYAEAEVQRYAPLARSGAETAEQLAAKRNQASQAALEVSTRRAAVASAERRIATLQAQVRQALAQGETAAAQLASANVNLQSTTITAGIGGRVGDLTVRVGQYVQAGTRLMSVVPLDQLYITANFKETQIGRMRPGQPVTVKLDALAGIDLKGHVESISPGTGAEFSLIPPQNATGNFTKIVQRIPVRVSLDASPELRRVLVPGLSVAVTVDTIGAKNELESMRRDQVERQKGRQ